jgi:hypothetical protein
MHLDREDLTNAMLKPLVAGTRRSERPGPDLHWCTRLCRPLPNYSATGPPAWLSSMAVWSTSYRCYRQT